MYFLINSGVLLYCITITVVLCALQLMISIMIEFKQGICKMKILFMDSDSKGFQEMGVSLKKGA